jgi:hypothetical protein
MNRAYQFGITLTTREPGELRRLAKEAARFKAKLKHEEMVKAQEQEKIQKALE